MFFVFDKKIFHMVEESRLGMRVYNCRAILLQHGLDPIGIVEPYVDKYLNTFVISIGQKLFKSLNEKLHLMTMIVIIEICEKHKRRFYLGDEIKETMKKNIFLTAEC
ncbi:hypothetical protein RF11_16033 [Thelohanellus kitauei]|uniref:Uncharacterized protein n=1 Tax=Thelohanellus kitauei TaxID=669202 RepID=A0A0C2MQG2_THEKT|nr:hypothetical protein RF11_16033 [Thelohanellus kitauei]